MSEAAPQPEVLTYTASDGYVCRYRRYAADRPRGRVVCLHGIQSHGGWYTRSCAEMARAGHEVFFLDRRGSGLNEAARGDAPGFRRLIDDVAEFLRPLRGRGDNLPTVLLAISWGGKLAAALPRRHPGLIDGLALLCPGFCPQVSPTLGQRLGILWARLRSPTRLFPIPLNDPALFTASETWRAFIREDPLALHHATARLLVESARLDGYLRWARRAVRVPVLLQLAGEDRIIDNARTRAFVGRFGSPDKRIIEYPGAHHTLEFEPPDHPFLADLIDWLSVTVRQAGGPGR